MNESHVTPPPAVLEAATLASPAVTAGNLLQQARERAGVHLGMLSVALKVPVRHLMALEADDHTPFTSPVFVRALTGSVCRHLQVDAAPILALLPRATSQLQAPPPGLEPPDWRARWVSRFWGVNRKYLLLATLLLVLIALVVGLPQGLFHAADSAQSPAPSAAAGSETPASPEPASTPMVVLLPSESVSETETSRALAGVKASAEAATAPGGKTALEVTFKGKSDESWVEVKDSGGAVVFSKLVKSGETHVVKGVPVLTVVVGMADAVDVQVRGQPLDLTPFSRGAVARFEVK